MDGLPNIVGDEPPLALSQRMQRELSYRLLPTTKTSAPLLGGESKFDYSIYQWTVLQTAEHSSLALLAI